MLRVNRHELRSIFKELLRREVTCQQHGRFLAVRDALRLLDHQRRRAAVRHLEALEAEAILEGVDRLVVLDAVGLDAVDDPDEARGGADDRGALRGVGNDVSLAVVRAAHHARGCAGAPCA